MTIPAKDPPIPFLLLLPVVPALMLLGILGVQNVKRTTFTTRVLLILFTVCLVIPALLVPNPLLATGGAILKSLLIAGFILTGVQLRHTCTLRYLIPGLGVILLTALAYSFSTQAYVPLTDRLSHPYYTSVSLGFTGTVAVWLALLLPRKTLLHPLLRLLTGASGLALLALSGSRGALLAVTAGLLAAAAHYAHTHWRNKTIRATTLASATLLLLSIPLATRHLNQLSDPVLTHLGSTSANGRDITWADTLDAIRAQPLTGYGPYQLGPQIAPVQQVGTCQWWPALEERGITCPALVRQLNNTWLIAHNAALQTLGESGPLGLLAQVTLCAYLLLYAWRTRQPLPFAVMVGLFTADLTDNVSMVPGAFFNALPWIAGGMGLAQTRETLSQDQPTTEAPTATIPTTLAPLPWVALGLLVPWSFPIWASALTQPQQNVTIHEVVASPEWQGNDPYPILLIASAPAGTYRVQTRICNQHGQQCHTVQISLLNQSRNSDFSTARINIPLLWPEQQISLIVRPSQTTSLNLRGFSTWQQKVRWTPQ